VREKNRLIAKTRGSSMYDAGGSAPSARTRFRLQSLGTHVLSMDKVAKTNLLNARAAMGPQARRSEALIAFHRSREPKIEF